MIERAEAIGQLWRDRPKNRLLLASLGFLAALAAYSWTCGDLDVSELFAARRRANLANFLRQEAWPHPLRGKAFTWSGLWQWMRPILAERGWDGALATFSIAVLAIVLAGLGAAALVPLAARTIATAEPYLPDPRAARTDPLWRALCQVTRTFFVLLRAIPEYVWAFLLLAMLGPSAWPAVLALAIHNAGILGRLGAETVENLEPTPLRAWRALGADRRQIVALAVPPLALGRFLLYFFYRFETCIREATVLGMLGVVSLGYWIQDARSRQFHDDMLLLVAVGMLMVLGADLLSYVARAFVRRAR